MLLRKLFSGKFLEDIRQVNGDRIIQLKFAGCDLSIIAELFGRGNLVVVDSHGIIQHALAFRSWKSREIRKGVEYTPPPFTDWFSMSRSELAGYIKGLDKAEASRKLGLGKAVEDVWDADADKFAGRLLELVGTPLKFEEVEAGFKKLDSEALDSERKQELSEKTKALEKSLEENRKLIEAYRREAAELRRLAEAIFMDLGAWDLKLAEARSKGKKRLKVS